MGPGKGPCRVHHRRRQGGLAISNGRLLNLEDGFVGFWYWNYAQGNQKRDMTLPGLELVRRLLLHVLPRGFVRILRYGLLSNRQRCEDPASCRQLLADFIVRASRKRGSSVNQQEQVWMGKWSGQTSKGRAFDSKSADQIHLNPND